MGHVITTVGGSGPNKQVIRYLTERVVGNGSFGVVFQAKCIETGETVRSLEGCAYLGGAGGGGRGGEAVGAELFRAPPAQQLAILAGGSCSWSSSARP